MFRFRYTTNLILPRSTERDGIRNHHLLPDCGLESLQFDADLHLVIGGRHFDDVTHGAPGLA